MKKIAIIISLLLLCSCASKNNTQNGYSYRVNGKKYTTHSSAEGFSQRGLASWYGKKFHGRKTANGETYDMYAMTCAHKTLPFNTRLEVTNLSNGKKTIVRVNDRGPFVKGRIIDLSYKAGKQIGIHITGTAPVRIRTLDNKKREVYEQGVFTVQVGAFANYDNAVRLKSKLEQTYNVVQIKEFNTDSRTFYRVRAGRFSNLSAAHQNEKRLRKMGYPNAFSVAVD